MVDYYNRLNVSKDASESEINRAYKRLAKELHPDKPGGSTQKFKLLQKAYETLKDPSKRKLYDIYGEKYYEKEEIQSNDRRGSDIIANITVTLGEVLIGKKKQITVKKKTVCNNCNGKGGEGKTDCHACFGKGSVITTVQFAPGIFQRIQQICNTCHGKGETIPEKQRCRTCSGQKLIMAETKVKVHIERGVFDGEKIILRESGHDIINGLSGDLVLIVKVEKHPLFERKGNHLFLNHNISLVEALTGFKHQIKSLDGRSLVFKSNDHIVYEPGCVKCIREEGLPIEKSPVSKGNLYITFNVVFPKNTLPASHKALLSNLIPSSLSLLCANDANCELENIDFEKEKVEWETSPRAKNKNSEENTSECRAM